METIDGRYMVAVVKKGRDLLHYFDKDPGRCTQTRTHCFVLRIFPYTNSVAVTESGEDSTQPRNTTS